jgi:hypothetical protein
MLISVKVVKHGRSLNVRWSKAEQTWTIQTGESHLMRV